MAHSTAEKAQRPRSDSKKLSPRLADMLSRTPLFSGTTAEEIGSMLGCLGTEQRRVKKGVTICHAGDHLSSMGMVLSGRIHIENDDPWGNRTILNSVEPGQVFGEAYAFIPDEPLMVNVVADLDSDLVFFNVKQLIKVCPSTCSHHSRLIQNLLMVTAKKNLQLSQRSFHTSAKSIRGRLLSYLSSQAARNSSNDFTIPFNRQQLADYLGVDRSAMSAELGKMQREGLLTTTKNQFQLKDIKTL